MTIPTISQLFTPLPSGVVDGVTPATVAAGTWLYNELQNGNNLNLPVTSWQSGGVAWTELMIVALGMAISDATISLHAQAAFLDFCATGTVTFTTLVNGQPVSQTVPVTPDPSIPSQNPTGALGWLDVLCDGRNVQRNLATFASGNLYIANTTGSSAGTFAALGFHALNGTTGSTYSNTGAFTASASSVLGTSVTSATAASPVVVTTSTAHGLTLGQTFVEYFTNLGVLPNGFYAANVTGTNTLSLTGTTGTGAYVSGGLVYQPQQVGFSADLIGPGSNAAIGQINATTTAVPGVFVYNGTAFAGSPYESNVALAARTRSQLGSLSLNGPKGAYNYAALTAVQILAAQSPSKTLTSAITREVDSSSLVTGIVTVTVANASGAVPGANDLPIIGATNASPIVLDLAASTFGLTTGMVAIVTGVEGNTAANGYWTITVVDGAHISLNGSTGNGSYVQGGIANVGDLGLVDSVIQAYAVPNGVTAQTQSAQPLNVNVAATVYVPQAFVADYGSNPTSNKGTVAVAAMFPNFPIGGIQNIDGQTGQGVIPLSEITEALMQAGTSGGIQYTISVSGLTLNGAALDILPSSTQVAVLGTIAITVQGV